MQVSAVVRAAFVAFGVLAALPAQAQEGASADYALISPPEEPAGPPLGPDETALLGKTLNFDPATLAAPAKPLRVPRIAEPEGFGVSRNGSTVVVKQPLPWDAKVGADLALASNPPADDRPVQPFAPASNGNSGAAWASVGVTDYATVDARVDPTKDQGRVGGTLKHSMPVGDSYSLTLQHSTAVTESFRAQGPSAPADLPLMALPQDSGAAPSQVWSNEKTVKFDVLGTGTSFAAGLASSSVDPVTHNKLSAEQKLFGNFNVTTAVTDVGQTGASKSISAGFKLNW